MTGSHREQKYPNRESNNTPKEIEFTSVKYSRHYDPKKQEKLLMEYTFRFNPEQKEIPNFHTVFITDTSGSMQGDPIAILKKTMSQWVQSASKNDTFSIVTFNKSVTLELTKGNSIQALQVINQMKADFSTNIVSALESITPTLIPTPEKTVLVFLTDGEDTIVGNKNINIELIIKKINQAFSEKGLITPRIIPIGIGPGFNPELFYKITKLQETPTFCIRTASEIETIFATIQAKLYAPWEPVQCKLTAGGNSQEEKGSINANTTMSIVYELSALEPIQEIDLQVGVWKRKTTLHLPDMQQISHDPTIITRYITNQSDELIRESFKLKAIESDLHKTNEVIRTTYGAHAALLAAVIRKAKSDSFGYLIGLFQPEKHLFMRAHTYQALNLMLSAARNDIKLTDAIRHHIQTIKDDAEKSYFTRLLNTFDQEEKNDFVTTHFFHLAKALSTFSELMQLAYEKSTPLLKRLELLLQQLIEINNPALQSAVTFIDLSLKDMRQRTKYINACYADKEKIDGNLLVKDAFSQYQSYREVVLGEKIQDLFLSGSIIESSSGIRSLGLSSLDRLESKDYHYTSKKNQPTLIMMQGKQRSEFTVVTRQFNFLKPSLSSICMLEVGVDCRIFVTVNLNDLENKVPNIENEFLLSEIDSIKKKISSVSTLNEKLQLLLSETRLLFRHSTQSYLASKEEGQSNRLRIYTPPKTADNFTISLNDFLKNRSGSTIHISFMAALILKQLLMNDPSNNGLKLNIFSYGQDYLWIVLHTNSEMYLIDPLLDQPTQLTPIFNLNDKDQRIAATKYYRNKNQYDAFHELICFYQPQHPIKNPTHEKQENFENHEIIFDLLFQLFVTNSHLWSRCATSRLFKFSLFLDLENLPPEIHAMHKLIITLENGPLTIDKKLKEISNLAKYYIVNKKLPSEKSSQTKLFIILKEMCLNDNGVSVLNQSSIDKLIDWLEKRTQAKPSKRRNYLDEASQFLFHESKRP